MNLHIFFEDFFWVISTLHGNVAIEHDINDQNDPDFLLLLLQRGNGFRTIDCRIQSRDGRNGNAQFLFLCPLLVDAVRTLQSLCYFGGLTNAIRNEQADRAGHDCHQDHDPLGGVLQEII